MALWNRPLAPVPKQGIQMPIGFGGGYGGGGNVPMIRPPTSPEGIQLHSGGSMDTGIGRGGMGGGMGIPPGSGGNIGNVLSRQSYMPSLKGYNNLTDTGGEGKGKSFLQTYLDLAQWAVPYATRELETRKKGLMEAETEGLIQRKNMFEDAMTPEGTVKSIDYGGGSAGGGGAGGGGGAAKGGGGAGGGPRVKRSGPTVGSSQGNKPFFDTKPSESYQKDAAAMKEKYGGFYGPEERAKAIEEQNKQAAKEMATEGRAGGGVESMTYPAMKSIAQTQAEARGVPESKSATVALAEESGGTSGTGLALNEQTTPGQGDPGINIDPGTGMMVAPTDEQLREMESEIAGIGGGKDYIDIYGSSGGDGGDGGGE